MSDRLIAFLLLCNLGTVVMLTLTLAADAMPLRLVEWILRHLRMDR